MLPPRHFFWALALTAQLLAGCSGGSSPAPAPVAPQPYSLSGTVRYEDVEYAETGWTGKTAYKPVRHMQLDLLDSSGALLTTGVTNGSGQFLFDNVLLAAAPATVRVVAESDATSGSQIAIHSVCLVAPCPVYSALYSLSGLDLSLPLVVDIPRAKNGGVFNMLDIYQSAFEFVASHPSALALPPLDVYWKSSGTYCTADGKIYVLSSSSDQDEYDDDVLWHEFAHFIEYSIDATDSPGGYHTFFDSDLDLRLAWSEGHADYLQTAIKRWLRGSHPERLSIPSAFSVSWYVDTNSSGSVLDWLLDGIYVQLAIDMAAPDTSFCVSGDCYVHASNEVAVANALWHGSETYTEPPYWVAFAEYLPTVNDGLSSVMDNLRNLEAYWDGLLLQLAPLGITESNALSSFSARSIHYAADAFEPDDAANDRAFLIDCASVASGVVCVNESHTLYRGSSLVDLDVVPISVTSGRSYAITTVPMVNGLDSYLEILDSTGTDVLASNDDALDCGTPGCSNDGIHYSSGLNYTPSASGTLHVRVKAVPYYVSNTLYRGWGAGAYGGYTLKVIAN